MGGSGSICEFGPPGDSRVAHVDPWDDLVAGLAREAVAAASVREQVVEILHGELERAGHGGGGALHAGAGASEGEKPGQRGGAAQPGAAPSRPGGGPTGCGKLRARYAAQRTPATGYAPQDPGERPWSRSHHSRVTRTHSPWLRQRSAGTSFTEPNAGRLGTPGVALSG